MLAKLRSYLDFRRLPEQAKSIHLLDQSSTRFDDPGADVVIRAGIDWLKRAQDRSASGDNGVSRSYSLISGWATSYPETTGYIVPTMIEYGHRYDDPDALDRARKMLDWLVDIQMDDGGFQGGKIDANPVVPVTFNTGQILIGLARGEAEFGQYRRAMQRAAQWLVDSLDDDGCWRKHPTPFAAQGEKAYETHVAWGLFEADRVMPGMGFGEAGLKQVRWALTKQRSNGWMADCCLTDPSKPLTHTLGYALRGIVEAYRFSEEDIYLEAAMNTADGLLSAVQPDGFLPGQLNPDWTAAVDWACLTGAVQIAHSCLMLYQVTGKESYRDFGYLLNQYVRQTIDVEGAPETRGGVKGSYPIYGAYGRYEYLNWAVKFCIDSNLCELDLRKVCAY